MEHNFQSGWGGGRAECSGYKSFYPEEGEHRELVLFYFPRVDFFVFSQCALLNKEVLKVSLLLAFLNAWIPNCT